MSPNSLGWCLTDGRSPNEILKITFSQSDFTSRQATVHTCGCWCSDPPSVTCNPSRSVVLAAGAGCAAWNPKGHSVAKPSQCYPSCCRKCCSHAQPWCNVLSITLALGLSQVCYLQQSHLCSRRVWKLLLTSLRFIVLKTTSIDCWRVTALISCW